MSEPKRRYSLMVGLGTACLIAGAVGGFFAAHWMTGDRSAMKDMDMAGVPEMGEMKGMTHEQGESSVSAPGSAAAMAIPAGTRQLIGVRSAPAARASLDQEIRTVGTVEYNERGLSKVNLKVSGWVKEVFVNSIGQPVHKGEPLFTLYSPDLLTSQDEYLVALRTQTMVAESPLADAREGATTMVASARERLHLWDMTDTQIDAVMRRGRAIPIVTVYAPSTGVVLKREAMPGKYVEPGATLYELASLETVWISADIYESEIAAIRLNQPAMVAFAAYPGESFQGKVSYIYPSLNTEARTVRVRIELPNSALKLKPGMYGNVILRTESVERLVVPKEAVLDSGLRQLVFLDQGHGVYQPTQVTLGRRGQDRVEVLEGLRDGDRVVTSAHFLLDAEAKLASASSMQAMMGRIGMADWQMRGAYEAKMEGMDMGKGGVSASPGHGENGLLEQAGGGRVKTSGEKGGMEGMQGMKGMGGMPGMEMGSKKEMTGAETRQMNGLTLSLTTAPETPKAGEVLLRLKVTGQAGKAVTNAQVFFVYTMPMPGMADSKATARHTKDGFYEGTVKFGMGGAWVVTVNMTVQGRPPIVETFQFTVAGGGM